MPPKRLILDLCAGTGAWSRPYTESDRYEVLLVDTIYGIDVRTFSVPRERVWGILAAPPCTMFCGSGAPWWPYRTEDQLREALDVVSACMRIIHACTPMWWCLENPVGRLGKWLGPPRMHFQPWEYGDAWTKRTSLWGNFTVPSYNMVACTEGSKTHYLWPQKDRAKIRSITPPGFAKQFFLANP